MNFRQESTTFGRRGRKSCCSCCRELVKQGDYSVEFPKLLAGLNVGRSVGWKGSRYQATSTATGAHASGAVPCRQSHHVLKEGTATVAEYDGMLCGYKGDHAARATWNEVI